MEANRATGLVNINKTVVQTPKITGFEQIAIA